MTDTRATGPITPLEYLSVLRDHVPGEPYASAGDFINTYGAQGWELVQVLIGKKYFVNEEFEVFYFKREL